MRIEVNDEKVRDNFDRSTINECMYQ